MKKKLLPSALDFSPLINFKFSILIDLIETKKHSIIFVFLTFYGCLSYVFKLTIPFLVFAVLLPTSVSAHRGAIGEIDDCRIRVGSERVHFTAYTPTLTPGKEYCKTIPQLGPTNLVFDYEGKELRNLTVEFEITKEPEGTRIFYQEPKTNKTGTVNGLVDFSQYGAGDYLAHVTIVHNGEKLDAHLPFKAGIEEKSYTGLIKIAFFIALFLAIFLMIRKAKTSDAKVATPPHDE